MTGLISCVDCRTETVTVDRLVCHRCLSGKADPDRYLADTRTDLQQYRLVLSSRFSDTKRSLNDMRAAARAAGFVPVEGPTVVRVVGQRSVYPGTLDSAWEMVRSNLDGVMLGDRTDVRSRSVTLIPGGYPMTVVEVRRMLDQELSGVGGVAR